MSPHAQTTIWTEAAMSGNRLQREGLDLGGSVQRLGEQLRRQFSDVPLEPLPEDMLALLQALKQMSE